MIGYTKDEVTVGVVGQGFVGSATKTTIEETIDRKVNAYDKNKDGFNSLKQKDQTMNSDIVFVCVPTPITDNKFDMTIVDSVISEINKNSIVVIKSTMKPTTTRKLSEKYPNLIFHCPEFLSEATALDDARNPFSIVLGHGDGAFKSDVMEWANLITSILPEPISTPIFTSFEEAEIFKYVHNCAGVVNIIFFNMMYDLAEQLGCDWSNISKAIRYDPYIPGRYSKVFHKDGRGAGGSCFIKDFKTMIELIEELKSVTDNERFDEVHSILSSIENINIDYLRKSNKSLDILDKIYN